MNNRIIGYCKAMAMLTREYNKRFPHVEGIIDIVETHSDKLFGMQLENPKFKGYCPYFTKVNYSHLKATLFELGACSSGIALEVQTILTNLPSCLSAWGRLTTPSIHTGYARCTGVVTVA